MTQLAFDAMPEPVSAPARKPANPLVEAHSILAQAQESFGEIEKMVAEHRKRDRIARSKWHAAQEQVAILARELDTEIVAFNAVLDSYNEAKAFIEDVKRAIGEFVPVNTSDYFCDTCEEIFPTDWHNGSPSDGVACHKCGTLAGRMTKDRQVA